ncbi:MAG: DUF4335 domain-containing protein [Synechococcus lacustris]
MTNFSLSGISSFSSAQLKLHFEESSCRLDLTGLPDVSASPSDASDGVPGQRLSILTGWELNLGQRAALQGKLEHLQALVAAVQPYVRHLVSNHPCPQGDPSSPVSLEPRGKGHRLQLRSSQANTEPLDLQLDDAELADLTQCLDQMLQDQRLGISLPLPAPQPLRRREQPRRKGAATGWAAPAAALGALLITAGLASVIPLPERKRPAAQPPAPTTSQR